MLKRRLSEHYTYEDRDLDQDIQYLHYDLGVPEELVKELDMIETSILELRKVVRSLLEAVSDLETDIIYLESKLQK
jgi:hypothetical protein